MSPINTSCPLLSVDRRPSVRAKSTRWTTISLFPFPLSSPTSPLFFLLSDGAQSKTPVDVVFFILVCLDFRLAVPLSGSISNSSNSAPIFGPPHRDSTGTTSVASASPFATAHPQENALPERQVAPHYPLLLPTGTTTTPTTTKFTLPQMMQYHTSPN